MTEKRTTDAAWRMGQRLGSVKVDKGLTKRELFAAMAIQSAITLPWAQGMPRHAAEVAVDLADELLRQLSLGSSNDGGAEHDM